MNIKAVLALCMLATASVAAQRAPAPAPGPASCTTIASLAAATPDLSILLQAVAAGGLVSTFSNPTSAITLFAPTNDAFASALRTLNLTAADLLASPALVPILTGHVVQGAVNSSALSNGLTVPTLLPGSNLTFVFASAPAPAPAPALRGAAPAPARAPIIQVRTPNSTATVVTPNVYACAAVVHVIDQVLLPPTSVINAALGGGRVVTI